MAGGVGEAVGGQRRCRWCVPQLTVHRSSLSAVSDAHGAHTPHVPDGAAPQEKGSGDAAPAGGGGGAEGGGRTGKRRFLKRAERRKASGTYADELMPLVRCFHMRRCVRACASDTLRAWPPISRCAQLDSVPALKVPVIYDLADLVRPKDLPVDFGPLGDYTSGRVAWPELPLPPVPSPEDRSPNALQVGPALPPDPEPWPGAPRLLTWRTRIILQNGTDQRHPLSNKVEVTCRLKEVGQAVGLRDVGLRWIRALCGPRRVVSCVGWGFVHRSTCLTRSWALVPPPSPPPGTRPGATPCAW